MYKTHCMVWFHFAPDIKSPILNPVAFYCSGGFVVTENIAVSRYYSAIGQFQVNSD